MQKEEIVQQIKEIITEFGGFYIGEVGDVEAQGICVNEMGNFVAIAEGFFDEVEVNIYEPSSFSSDSVDDYTLTYEEFDKDVLEKILALCEQYKESQEE
jgi:nucleoside-specific outer membrane channel protein Tsx